MSDTAPTMKIKTILAPESVALDVRAADKPTLLRDLAQRAASAAHLPADAVFNELSRREELGSTGIGGGIAIPHARFTGIQLPMAIAARIKPPVNFDAIDGLPIDLVFVLLVPTSSNGVHLNALAAVSRKLRDNSVLERLRSSKTAESFYRTLTEG